MRRIHAVLLMLALALGLLALPTPAFAAVGDTFTEPITIGTDKVDCTFKVTGASTVSVGEGGFVIRNDNASYYSVESADPALTRLTTVRSSSDNYVLDAAGALVIPSSITHGGTTYTVSSIAPGAFYQGVGITSVTIPNSVTSIGAGAFCQCTALTSVTIPASVTQIPGYCFANCEALRTVEGAANVTAIGISAYRTCKALHSMAIPAKVTTIGDYAFRDCAALVDVTMGNAVTSVGAYAFSRDSALESITLSTSLTELPDYLFTQDYNLSTVKNTSQVTSLGEYVFANCSNLKSFTIPSGVSVIPEQAFSETGLTAITIPDGVERIDWNAFRYCRNLRSVTFSNNSNCKLGYQAFAGCTALEAVDLSNVSEFEEAEYLGSYAFSGCTALKSVTLGDRITVIPEGTFRYCRALTSITFPSQVTTLGEDAFCGCTGLNAVTIPATLTSLNNDAFNECYSLVALVLEGDAVKTLNSAWSSTYAYEFTQGFCHLYVSDSLVSAYKADAKWSSLADYILPLSQKPSDTHIYALLKTDGTLVQCNASGSALSGGKSFVVQDNAETDYAKYAITDVRFQSGITELPLGAFAYCKALQSVSLPTSVTSIGQTAFYRCNALRSVSGSKVAEVQYMAFGDCTSLTDVGFMGQISELQPCSFQGCTALREAKLSATLQNIDDQAFSGCTNLSEVTLPTDSAYLEIGYQAFSGCSALEGVNLPTSLANLGDEAFGWSGLKSVDVPGVLFSCGTGVFSTCRHLTTANVRPTGGYVQNSMFKDCTALRSVTLAEGVDTIQGSVFSGCSGLQRVDFPSSMFSITDRAFQYCSGLWEVALPEGLGMMGAAFDQCTGLSTLELPGSLYYVTGASSGNDHYGAFSNCTGLSSVSFGADYSADLGLAMFSGCEALRSLDIPDVVETVDSFALYCCYLLRDLHLPASLSYLSEDCFSHCLSLTEVDLSYAEGLRLDSYLGGQFGSCYNLKKVTLPDGLDCISPAMFTYCDSLTEITIPSSVDYVCSVAFRDCAALKTVIFENDCSACEFSTTYGDVFEGCDALTTVVYREKKPQDGALSFPNNPTFYYTVRYYPLEELTSDRANCIGQLTVKAGTNVLGSSAPAASAIYDGAWIQGTKAEPAINASKLSDSGWVLPGTWTGVLFVTQPKGGDTADGSFTLSAEARVRRVSNGSATDTGDSVSYAWYACDADGNRTGNAVGTGATLALTGLSEGRHYYVCVASSTASGLNRPTATSQVACVNIKTGRLSASPESISYRWPVSDSNSGYGPIVTISNTSSFTIRNIKWKSKNGYFEIYRQTSGDWGDLDAGVSFNSTLHPRIPDAEAREYQDALIVTSDNAVMLEIPVTLKFYEVEGSYADFSYTSKNGATIRDTTVDFGTLEEGYTNPQDNYGIQCTLWAEDGTVTFSGRTNPTHFTIYNEGISSYPWTVSNMGLGLKIAPKAGLAAGTYEDSYTYSYTNSDGRTGKLTIALKVRVRGAGGISVSPTSCSWNSAEEGYAALTSKTITVTNNEDSAITLQGSTPQSFTVQGASSLSIPAGQSKTITVTPKTGLAVGSYDETLKLTSSSGSSKNVELHFKVTAKPVPATSVELPDALELEVGDKATLEASVLPAAADQTLTWTSSNTKVARVDASSGKVTAVGEGEATITATASNGVSADCVVTVSAKPAPDEKWKRLWGNTSLDTMEAIVVEGSETGAWKSDEAVLATNASYPDALVASSVAGAVEGPVVLTGSKSLSVQAERQLRELGIKKVYVMGGTFAVSDAVTQKLTSMGIDFERIKGDDRQGTSLDSLRWLREERHIDVDTVIIATGKNFADALAVGPWCCANCAPILLTGAKSTELNADQYAALDGVKKAFIVGGYAAVSDTVYQKLESMGIEVRRLAGLTRYDTAQVIADWEFYEQDMTLDHVSVATGDNFPDALAGAALCGANNSILVLANDNVLANAKKRLSTSLEIIEFNADDVELGYALGGPVAVSDSLFAYLESLTE